MQSRTVLVAVVALVAQLAPCRADSPVEKVVQLLEELQARLKQDGADEQGVFNKYACWCETTTQRKAAAITEGRASLRRLGTTILSEKGKIATLASEIAELTADIKKNEEAQQVATAIRQKENAAFQAESAELQQAIAALEKAILVLKGATGASAAAAGALAEVRAVLKPHAARLRLSARELALLEARGGGGRYAPQSATVQGILSDMYTSFTSNLEAMTHDEGTRSRAYEDLIAVKQKELAILRESLAKKETAKAEAETILADATQSYADTEEQLKADVEFFDVTKSSCEAKTSEWGARKALRDEEMAGVAEALKILSSDEARELFGKSIKAGVGTGTFLQLGQSSMAQPVASAYRSLQAHAQKAHSLRLASLAATLRTTAVGHFDQVLSAIDTMVAELHEEGKQDIQKRDECKDELHKIASTVADVSWKIENNKAKITKLEALVQTKEDEKTRTIEEIATVTSDIGDMEEQRVAENQKFLASKDDDQKAIELLEQAKTTLSQYFANNKIALGPLGNDAAPAAAPAAALLEHAAAPAGALEDPDVAPEAKFSGKGKRKTESKGIISILTMIIEDLQEEIKSGIEGEAAAQLDFEKRLAAAKKLHSELVDKKTNIEETIADKNEEIAGEKTTLEENEKDLADQNKMEADMRPSCDWISEHFAERAEKRAVEIDGLQKAREFLAGMEPDMSMAQTKSRAFDDSALQQISFKSLSFLQRS